MNKITVLFFATFRDKAGTNRTELEIPEGTTIDGLRRILSEKFPGLESLADHALASINKEYAFPEQEIPDGAEVPVGTPLSREGDGREMGRVASVVRSSVRS